MLAVVLFTASILLFALVYLLAHALDYVHEHPEVLTGSSALAYQQCQLTLQQIVSRSKEIAEIVSSATQVAWLAPNGHFYAVSGEGVEEHRPGRVYRLGWQQIGGVGMQMQPGFRFVDARRDLPGDTRATTGYSFFLLVVPHSGDTITIHIPTYDRADAIDFAAHTLALAGHHFKRINVFGFDRPPRQFRRRT